jgi:hypothetical protein
MRCSLAEHSLEKLIFEPGDLMPLVRKILTALATSDLAEVPAGLPAEPETSDELTVTR